MQKTVVSIAAVAAALAGGALPASAKSRGALDPITAAYNPGTREYCVRSGWGHLSRIADRPVREGDCGDARAWRKRGLEFDPVAVHRPISTRSLVIAER